MDLAWSNVFVMPGGILNAAGKCGSPTPGMSDGSEDAVSPLFRLFVDNALGKGAIPFPIAGFQGGQKATSDSEAILAGLVQAVRKEMGHELFAIPVFGMGPSPPNELLNFGGEETAEEGIRREVTVPGMSCPADIKELLQFSTPAAGPVVTSEVMEASNHPMTNVSVADTLLGNKGEIVSLPAGGASAASPPEEGKAVASPPAEGKAVASPPAEGKVVVSPPAEGKVVVSPPTEGKAVASPPAGSQVAASHRTYGEGVVLPVEKAEGNSGKGRISTDQALAGATTRLGGHSRGSENAQSPIPVVAQAAVVSEKWPAVEPPLPPQGKPEGVLPPVVRGVPGELPQVALAANVTAAGEGAAMKQGIMAGWNEPSMVRQGDTSLPAGRPAEDLRGSEEFRQAVLPLIRDRLSLGEPRAQETSGRAHKITEMGVTSSSYVDSRAGDKPAVSSKWVMGSLGSPDGDEIATPVDGAAGVPSPGEPRSQRAAHALPNQKPATGEAESMAGQKTLVDYANSPQRPLVQEGSQAPASPVFARETLQIPAEAINAQVASRLAQAVRRGDGEITLLLHPASLGQVRARLSFAGTNEGTTVTLQLTVENAGVQRAIQEALPQLRLSLDARGINLGSCDVNLAGQGGFHDQWHGDAWWNSLPHSEGADSLSMEQEGDLTALPLYQNAHGLLDVMV